MRKGEAIARVAGILAGNLSASDFREATGLDEDEVSEADARRLDQAIEEVKDRLFRMGSRRERT